MKFPVELLRYCWFIAGPTASGKSALGLKLAESLNGEIISMDSMAIYRGMDIGTAKASMEERSKVPHHAVDIIDPHEEFSTAEFLSLSLRVSQEIVNRGRTPIFLGGTGLYLRSLLRGVFEGPPADWEFRNRLIERAKSQPDDWLHSELSKVDPASAKRLHPNDSRRLVRALEIHHLTGTPASELHQEHPLSPDERPSTVFWIHPPRAWLHDRINGRVDWMFDHGLEAEVRQLLDRPEPLSRTASQALGYREVIDWFEGRLESRAACIELIQTRTRQFAKRQHTWFRNLEECREVPIQENESSEELAVKLQTAGVRSI